uniref:Ethanolamine utilization protein EutJ n=1 Tax=Desulfatirhabdium butyrativorans TaxID=340467 RepID=A0A7C4W1R7_9BACT
MKRMIFMWIVSLLLMSAHQPSIATEALRIASIYALSGQIGVSQRNSVMGVRCGVESVNREGGVLGKPIELIEIDNLGSPIGSKQAAEKAVALGVTAIIGLAWSSHALAAAPIAQQAGIPLITNISTHPSITEIGDYIFRACFSDRFAGRVMAAFVRNDLKAETVAIAQDLSSSYSMGLADIFEKQFRQEGGRIIDRISYKQPIENFDKIVDAVVKANADVLFIPGYDESATIIRKARQKGLKSIPIGGDGWNFGEFFRRADGKASGAYFWTHYVTHSGSAQALRFESECPQILQGQSMVPGAALGYDAARLLADAIRRAGSTDRKAIRDALAATRDFEGATGRISFEEGSRDPQKPLAIMQIQGDEAVLVKSYHP